MAIFRYVPNLNLTELSADPDLQGRSVVSSPPDIRYDTETAELLAVLGDSARILVMAERQELAQGTILYWDVTGNQWIQLPIGTPLQVLRVNAGGDDLEWAAGGGGGGAVDSVFGRTGVVVAASGDYAASQVTNDSAVAGATVKAALDTLGSVASSYPIQKVNDCVGWYDAEYRWDYDGSGGTGPADGDADHIGVNELSTGSGGFPGSGQLYTGAYAFFVGARELTHVADFKTPAGPGAGGDDYKIHSGFDSASSGETTEPANACEFRYQQGVNGGRWQAVCRSAGSETASDTGVAFAADTWITTRVVINASGTLASFFLNGSLVATVGTNLPASTEHLRSWLRIRVFSGTTAWTIYADRIGYRVT